jgi:Asp-tRNA(Asn)/Glu-tRNA(Gln) amidotransferase A subunit family amidase
MPTQHGSKSYRGHEPGEDAPAISVLRAAGALIIGKTVSVELGQIPQVKSLADDW